MLAQNPGNISAFEIQMWVKWASDAYQAYIKLKSSQKRSIFNKVVHCSSTNVYEYMLCVIVYEYMLCLFHHYLV
jgi:hypothetical protein